MLTIDALRAFGADVDDGLARCMNKEDFYLRMVGKAAEVTYVDDLEAALNEGDVKKAFECAHALKGVYANLSLTPLYTPSSDLTELLRTGSMERYEPSLSALKQKAGELKELL